MRLGVAVADQVGDAAGDDACLAGSGAGQDEQRSVDVQDRFALFGIERFEELHRARGQAELEARKRSSLASSRAPSAVAPSATIRP